MRFFRSLLIAVCCAMVCAVATAQVVYNGSTVYNPGRSAIQASNPGTAATDNAYLEAKVAGTTAGDPHLRLTIPGGTSWYFASDNSDSDKLKIGTGTAVGTNTFLTMDSAGFLGLGVTPSTNFHVSQTSTAAVSIRLDNLNNSTVTSQARVQALTGGSGGGDPVFMWSISGVLDYYLGLDNSAAGDPLIFGSGTTVGTNPHVQIDTSGATAGDLSVRGGRLYGTALHNNATALSGTTNQYVGSGTYTPTLTAVANVAASTARVTQWTRVGNVLSVAGQMDIDPTTTATLTQLGISLPIASALANAFECGGTAAAGSLSAANSDSAAIFADAANDRAQLQWTPVDVTNQTWSFSFICQIL